MKEIFSSVISLTLKAGGKPTGRQMTSFGFAQQLPLRSDRQITPSAFPPDFILLSVSSYKVSV